MKLWRTVKTRQGPFSTLRLDDTFKQKRKDNDNNLAEKKDIKANLHLAEVYFML